MNFVNAGSTQFTGQGTVSLSLMLAVRLSLAGHVGINGLVGPEITGTVDTDTTSTQTCGTVGVQVHADLTAHADVFFRSFRFEIGSFAWPKQPFELPNICGTASSTQGTLAIVAGAVGQDELAIRWPSRPGDKQPTDQR